MPSVAILVDALVGFIEKPGATLMPQVTAGPLGMLAQFQVEASTRQ